MKPLLPIVDAEVGFSLAKSVGERGDSEFINSELRHINKENPTVADFIKKWAELGRCSIHTKFCGILVYKLLRSQAEADRMAEDLNLGD
jgi:hypothetical protein